MTEKSVKVPKNKNKQSQLKMKQKKVQSDSDISDVEGNASKIDEKQLKQISTEVTDLLASLKKEHGIEDEPIVATSKGKEKPTEKVKKNKKDTKNVQNASPVVARKTKQNGQQVGKKLPIKQEIPKANENKKKKPAKGKIEGAKKEKIPNAVAAQPQEKLVKKKKNKNQKRAAENVDVKAETTDELPAKKIKQNATQNQTKKQKQKENKVEAEPAGKKEPNVKNEKSEEGEKTEETNQEAVKKEHHLNTAVPVFVGNLPVNIKRLKLLKMFKKFGKVLSIRFRTNTGKSFLRKAQLGKVPHLIAFIYFETHESAEASVVLSGEKIGDNVITVDVDSKEKIANIKPQNTVVVGNLRYAVTDHILREAFKCCGEIEHIRVVQSDKGCKGVAFVRFAQPESCALAIKLNGTSILDREIRVEKYKANKSPGEKNVKKAKTPKPVQKKKAANKNAANKATQQADTNGEIKKKKKKNKEFLGVKSNDAKKTKLNKVIKKKKKSKLSDEKRLAMKVAPKAEKA